MKKRFVVINRNSDRTLFPLSADQVNSEFDNFQSTLALYWKHHNIAAKSERVFTLFATDME